MPFVPVNVVLDRPLHANAMINIPYPSGKTEGYFFAGYNHTMSIDGAFFRCPRDFIISTSTDYLVLTWRGDTPIPSGTLLNIQMDAPGGDFYLDQRTGVTVQNMVMCGTYLVNLGSPNASEPEWFVSSAEISASQSLKLINQIPDCPRNIMINSSKDNSHCTFTIEGEDVYARGMLEKIQGPSSETTHGNKAFHKIHKITSSHPCNGKISIGTGNRIGLPMYLPSPGFLMREMISGITHTTGTILCGEKLPPSAITGDCRGTYTPYEETMLNGKNSFYLMFALPNPGNIGMPDYTG
jgi:hypothetical protein